MPAELQGSEGFGAENAELPGLVLRKDTPAWIRSREFFLSGIRTVILLLPK
jgi:hypothetical protein